MLAVSVLPLRSPWVLWPGLPGIVVHCYLLFPGERSAPGLTELKTTFSARGLSDRLPG